MKSLLPALAALALAAAAPLAADLTSYPIGEKVTASPSVMIAPQAIPTTLTSVVSVDVYLVGLVISAPSTVTVTVQDQQGTPVPLVPAIVTAANTVYVLNLPFLYWCPGGFRIQASGAGANIFAVWKVK